VVHEQAELDAHSDATGERNERLGNDPTQQNIGRGSTPAEDAESSDPTGR